jgi:hypothetical protein
LELVGIFAAAGGCKGGVSRCDAEALSMLTAFIAIAHALASQ